ncbi:MAG: YfhO family protein, partial [Faecalibacillus sp.]|uniref:YfhO family protein n=1 Tax=Faecalibacillus sp. TaxID=2678891 RepID=UPI00399C2A77
SKGHYDIKNIKTYSLDKNTIKKRNQEVDCLKIEKGKDILKGTIDVKNDGYFITRIPYDRGYSIYIDGKVVNSEIVNEAFLGCQIHQGKHHIQIKFTPTGYRLGGILFYFGFMVVFINYIIERRRKDER